MKALLTSLIALSWLAISIFPEPAQAARVGGGRSVGVQRSVTPPPRAAQPAQNQAASAAAPAAAPAAAAGGNRWLAPLAGLAAGLGLGWLISQGGFGALGSALLVALLAGVAVFVLLRVFARSRPQMQSAAYGGTARVANPDPVGSPIGAQWAGAGGAG
ncbi:MAG: Tim44 domain-containing protein, partial [Burkholderiales bacterium]|nr:Tim44 domain-containing protein [Burkholderiales bacterium]